MMSASRRRGTVIARLSPTHPHTEPAMRSLVASALVLGMIAVGSPARAQESAPPPTRTHHRSGDVTGVSLWGILAYGYYNSYYAAYSGGLGIGGRYAFPLGSSGLFRNNPNLSDQFALELGADLVFWNGFGAAFTTIIPTVGVMWVFWLDHGKLGLYPKLDLGLNLYLSSIPGASGIGEFYWDGLAGIIYRLGTVSLRGEVGRGMLKVGVALNF